MCSYRRDYGFRGNPINFRPTLPNDTYYADVDGVLDMRYRGRRRGHRKQYLA